MALDIDAYLAEKFVFEDIVTAPWSGDHDLVTHNGWGVSYKHGYDSPAVTLGISRAVYKDDGSTGLDRVIDYFEEHPISGTVFDGHYENDYIGDNRDANIVDASKAAYEAGALKYMIRR